MEYVDALIHGVLLGGLYALFAVGLSIMFGVMRIVNLAHGDFAVVAAFIAFVIIGETALPLWLVVLITVPLFSIIGYFLQRTLIQKSISAGPLSTLLVTFGLSIVLQNALQEMFSANTRTLDAGALATASIDIGTITIPVLGIIGLVLAILVITAIQLFLKRSPTGRMMRAASDDQEVAAITGGNAKHIYGLATAIAFATVAIAGILFAIRSSFEPSGGPLRLVFAFEAVIIGGLGSLWGTLLGGLALGITQNVVAVFDPSSSILAGHILFLIILVFRPQGLIPTRSL